MIPIFYAHSILSGASDRPETPIISVIKSASQEFPIDDGHAFYAIQLYAKRNEHMHCMVRYFIKTRNWRALAEQLAKDLRDIPAIFGKKAQHFMIRVVNRVKDRFFISLKNPEKPVLSEEGLRRDAEASKRYINRREAEMQRLQKQAEEEARVKRTSDETFEEALLQKKERSERQVPKVDDVGDLFL